MNVKRLCLVSALAAVFTFLLAGVGYAHGWEGGLSGPPTTELRGISADIGTSRPYYVANGQFSSAWVMIYNDSGAGGYMQVGWDEENGLYNGTIREFTAWAYYDGADEHLSFYRAVSPGSTHHYAINDDSGRNNYYLYVDGVEKGHLSEPAIKAWWTPKQYAVMGEVSNSLGTYFPGRISYKNHVGGSSYKNLAGSWPTAYFQNGDYDEDRSGEVVGISNAGSSNQFDMYDVRVN